MQSSGEGVNVNAKTEVHVNTLLDTGELWIVSHLRALFIYCAITVPYGVLFIWKKCLLPWVQFYY